MLVGAALAACDTPSSERSPTATTGGPKIVVLGTVQDGGLPHAGCRCVRCRAARDLPDRRRHVSSLAVVDPAGDRTWLIDATPDLREQLERVRELRGGAPDGIDRSPVDGVLLTHAHIGHYTGLAFFGFEALHTQGLPVYCTQRMADYLRANGPWSQLVELGNIDLRIIRPGERFDLSPELRVTPLAVPHREEFSDTVGFIVSGPRATLLYIPDTDPWAAWDPPIEQLLGGVDVALLDGTFYSGRELPGRDLTRIGHPLIVDSMDRLEPLMRGGRLRVLFTHLNHSNPALDPADEAWAEIDRRGFGILAEGAEIPL